MPRQARKNTPYKQRNSQGNSNSTGSGSFHGFQVNFQFLCLMKISENLKVFLCFQGDRNTTLP